MELNNVFEYIISAMIVLIIGTLSYMIGNVMLPPPDSNIPMWPINVFLRTIIGGLIILILFGLIKEVKSKVFD